MSHARHVDTLPIWPSAARIMATCAIFAFHYLGLVGRYQYRLSLWALVTFSLLTGYLAQPRSRSRRQWAVRRYFSIMIPHWLVTLPVIGANWVVGYKPVSWASALVTFLGGNLFLQNPLYVITWYVGFVLLLYAYLFVDGFLKGWTRLLLAAAGFLFFGTWLELRENYLAFLAGLAMAAWLPPQPNEHRGVQMRVVARNLFRMQEVCYPFFLVHGAVLLAVLRVLPSGPAAIAVAFGASVIGALAVDAISRPLLREVLSWEAGRVRLPDTIVSNPPIERA